MKSINLGTPVSVNNVTYAGARDSALNSKVFSTGSGKHVLLSFRGTATPTVVVTFISIDGSNNITTSASTFLPITFGSSSSHRTYHSYHKLDDDTCYFTLGGYGVKINLDHVGETATLGSNDNITTTKTYSQSFDAGNKRIVMYNQSKQAVMLEFDASNNLTLGTEVVLTGNLVPSTGLDGTLKDTNTLLVNGGSNGILFLDVSTSNVSQIKVNSSVMSTTGKNSIVKLSTSKFLLGSGTETVVVDIDGSNNCTFGTVNSTLYGYRPSIAPPRTTLESLETVIFFTELSSTVKHRLLPIEITGNEIITGTQSAQYNVHSSYSVESPYGGITSIGGNRYLIYDLSINLSGNDSGGVLCVAEIAGPQYNTSGNAVSDNLVLVDSFNEVYVEVIESLPANTDITYEYSLDDGSNWNPITESIWTGVISSNQIKVRMNLSTTDTSVTPTLDNIKVKVRTV